MEAIPSRPVRGRGEEVTGIACPGRPGVLGVSTENDHFRFRCRICHVYSLQDLIEAKEQRLEDLLLAPVMVALARGESVRPRRGRQAARG